MSKLKIHLIACWIMMAIFLLGFLAFLGFHYYTFNFMYLGLCIAIVGMYFCFYNAVKETWGKK